MLDIDAFIIERLKKQQRQRELEDESHRIWLPIPQPELKPKEEQREPKRVIEIQL
jgi:hypothetical protein